MTDVATIGGIGGSAQHAPAAVVHAAAQNLSQQNTAPIASAGQAPVISPKIVIDPLAGVITEYVNSQGKVTQQTPSVAAVAYLHAGLTAQGLNKPTPQEAQHKASAVA
jgi:hypothetical protein